MKWHSRPVLLAPRSFTSSRLCVGEKGDCIPLVQVDIGLLADEVGVTATDTLDLGEGVNDLLLAGDVGVEKTKDELEVRLLPRYERHVGQPVPMDGFDVACDVNF